MGARLYQTASFPLRLGKIVGEALLADCIRDSGGKRHDWTSPVRRPFYNSPIRYKT